MDTIPSPYASIAGLDQTNSTSSEVLSRPEFGGFIGTSSVMQTVYDHIERAARSQAPVFITGESGTGKDICAEAIHKYGPRTGKPFVALNCAAIPKDLIESQLFGHVKGAFTGAIHDHDGAALMANGGTLFLDEIGEMDFNIQSKLLRFLQNFTFMRVGSTRVESTDVRVICATNRNPLVDVQTGRFREDLYYRLHVLPLSMPPLRERGDDIVDLAYTFLKKYSLQENKKFVSFTPEAEMFLKHYPWPGNIRELQNIIRQSVVMNDGRIMTAVMLPDYVRVINQANGVSALQQGVQTPDKIRPLWVVERNAIETAIDACHGNIPKAAAMLEISPSTIYRKKLGWDQGISTVHEG